MRRLFLLILILLAAYIAYPYWTLYRLDQAVLSNDKDSLKSIVDFPAIQASLKGRAQEEILAKTKELSKTRPALAGIGKALTEAFGSSIVGGAVDSLVTPETILENPTVVERRENDEGFEGFVRYAFFSGPTTFKFELKNPKEADSPIVSAFMTLEGVRWRVTKVDLPPLDALFPGTN